jgi:hypothetical protein
MFPDPTLGGMVGANLDLNADEYGDGSPDIIQDEIVKFTPAMLRTKSFLVRQIEGDGPRSIIEFTSSGYDRFYPSYDTLSDESGTWSISNDSQSFMLNQSGERTTATLINGYFEHSRKLEFNVDWQDEEGSVEVEMDLVTKFSAFTNAMVAGKRLWANPEGPEIDLDVQLHSDQSYDQNYSNTSGTWTVVNGALILTPTDEGMVSTYTIIKAYMTEGGKAYLALDLNGGVATLSGDLYWY